VVASKSAPLNFVNGDVQPHNVVALGSYLKKKVAKKTAWCKGFGLTKCPVFWSKTVPLGGQTEVLLSKTPAGQYQFYCTIHPGMKGTLVVQ
jgi:plastocyanin